MVVAQSHENVGQLRVAVNYAGTPLRGDNGQVQLDSRSYFHNTSIEGKAPAFAEVTRPLADSMKTPNQYVQAGQQHIDAAHRVRSSAPRRMFHSKPTSPTVRKCMPHAMPTIKKTVRHGRHPMLQHMFWDAHLMALSGCGFHKLNELL